MMGQLKKIDILRKNPMACFEVEHIPDLANWQTVITSQTTILTEEWPFTSETLSRITGITFRILLTEKTGRFEEGQQEANTFY
jgi:hypothetical protein